MDQKGRMNQDIKEYLIVMGLAIPVGAHIKDCDVNREGTWFYKLEGFVTLSSYTTLIDTKVQGFTVAGEWEKGKMRVLVSETLKKY